MNVKSIIIISVVAVTTIILLATSVSYKSKNEDLELRISELETENENLKKKVADINEEKEELLSQFSELSKRQLNSFEQSINNSNANPLGIIDNNISSTTLGRGIAVVVYKPSSCDYFILENSSGYIVAEWMGSNDPDLGDKLTGDFNSFGSRDFYNQSKDSECHLWIDDYMLSRESSLEKIQEKCN